jgi:hypothetical protein
MGAIIELTDHEWAVVDDLFDPSGASRRSRPLLAPADGRGDPVPRAHRLPVAILA